MQLTRTLSPKFIGSLNNLYTDEKSWWRKIADDKDIFVLIRNNEIRVQANGGLLLQINQDSQSNIVCKIHEDFLSLRSEKNPYIVLDEMTSGPIQRVEGLNGFAKHYLKIKRRINIFTGKERQAVQYMANNVSQIVDIEIGFEGELKQNASKKSVPRIDMAAITDKGTLVFFEVKLFSNSEIRSKKTPKVVSQLQKYQKLLSQKGNEIITAYQEQLNIYAQLKGNFFENRSRKISNLSIHPHTRLIITDFDASQRDLMLPTVQKSIEKGTGWAEGNKDFIATGDCKNLAKSSRLFLGLK
jgi:hypothetical protein